MTRFIIPCPGSGLHLEIMKLIAKVAAQNLNGITLEAIISQLSVNPGWDALAILLPVRCFKYDPSIKFSLKFLRKNPWARKKVEDIFLLQLKNSNIT